MNKFTENNQATNKEDYILESLGKLLLNTSIYIKDENDLYQEYIVEDDPRVGLLEIRLKRDMRFVTHIGVRDLYIVNGKISCDRVINLENLGNDFALLGSGLYSLV